MRILIIAVGRVKTGPEAQLVDDYLDRFARAGRSVGLPPVDLIQIDDRRGGGMTAEAALISRAVPPAAALAVLDERGKEMTSPEFAERIAGCRDAARDIAFVIGGADGIDPDLRDRAELSISFGRMVWPHLMARVMLAEQIYRAATILSGSPYHRY